jgi:hypothetical protein
MMLFQLEKRGEVKSFAQVLVLAEFSDTPWEQVIQGLIFLCNYVLMMSTDYQHILSSHLTIGDLRPLFFHLHTHIMSVMSLHFYTPV